MPSVMAAGTSSKCSEVEPVLDCGSKRLKGEEKGFFPAGVKAVTSLAMLRASASAKASGGRRAASEWKADARLEKSQRATVGFVEGRRRVERSFAVAASRKSVSASETEGRRGEDCGAIADDGGKVEVGEGGGAEFGLGEEFGFVPIL